MSDAPIIDIDNRIRLLGTAHVASASVAAVKHHIEEFQPDVIAVELCQSRHKALAEDRRLDKEGLLKVIKEGKAPLVLVQSLLAAEQRRMGMDEDIQPGAELMAAVKEGEERDLEVVLVDRDIQTTLRRAWKKMGFREKIRLLYSLLGEDEEEEDFDLEEMLADQDLLSSLLEEFRTISAGAGTVLIDERDEYIASGISVISPEKKVLAVLGAGHLQGVAKILKTDEIVDRRQELDTLTKKGPIAKSVPWLLPIAVFSLMAWLLYQGESEALFTAGAIWLAANAIAAALFCALAGGHPIAILVAALASPITSLNPMLAAGWFAGYAQMKLKEPTAEDLQEFIKLDSMKLFWSNRAGRVLLVTSLTNLGSMAGAWIAAPLIAAGL